MRTASTTARPRSARESSFVSGSTTWISIVASFTILSLFVVAMVCFRILYTHSVEHTAIVWNLLLAWIPFGMALIVSRAATTGISGRVLGALAAVWLIFLPNAPYTLTDLKYVGAGEHVPILYDVLLLSAAAWTGLLLGFTSLLSMQALVRRLLGTATAWALVLCALTTSSFGIYLGRVQRWNSWDLFLRPGPLGVDLAHSLHDPPALALTALLTAFLLSGYLAIYSLGTRASAFWAPSVRRPAS